jgi:hypothetical protein
MERRQRRRIPSAGTATIRRASGDQAEFALRDLSESGARVVGNLRLVEGELVHVSLELDGKVLSIIASVLRTEPQTAQAAIEFRDLSSEMQQSIEHAIDSMIARVLASSPPRVLVLHPDAEVGAALERDLSRLERGATLCSTVVEALWAMQNATARHVAIIVSREMASEVVQHFADDHPGVRRILLFGEQLESVDHGVSIDAVLRTPWRIRALARALGIDATDSTMAMLPASDDPAS